MKIKNVVGKIKAKKTELFPSMHKKLRLYYAENYETKQLDENLVLYETRDGTSIVDSPYAIFLELASNNKYSDLKHIWIVDENIENIESCIPKNLRGKVEFIKRGTISYVDAMLRAKYLISNATFETFFTKREGQIYINTWHGTPLKNMGFDIPGFVNHSQNVIRNFMMADFILSPNKHTTRIFTESYKLNGIYPGEILEGGYPRIDAIFNSDEDYVKERLRSYGTKIGEKPVMLFCPTWKGSSITETTDDIDQIVTETLILVDKFKSDYEVLIKVHPFVFSRIKEDRRVKDYLVSDLVDANQVLSIVDLLVTDYSSIFFDFLVTKKPIIFYSWDKDLYEKNRGMYLTEEEMPGPIVENIFDLVNCIENIDIIFKEFKENYQYLSNRMTPYEDGHVTQRYINYIFENINDGKIKVYNIDSNKKKLLIYPGGMVNNGITTSALNLINNIDYNRYDVTVILNSNRNIEANNNIKLLNKNARTIFRFGVNLLTKQESEVDKDFNVNGLPKESRDLYPEIGYQREMKRLTADLKFDVAIDFSGYSYFWARHILSANAEKYVVFMHNDLKADSEKVINGKQPRKTDLESLFSIYYKFDKILSVSPMTRDVNLEKLSEYVSTKQMSYVYNSINIDEILLKELSHKNEDKQLVVETEAMIVKDNISVNVFKNITKILNHDFNLMELKKENKVMCHGIFKNNEKSYSKVVIDGVYVGWIESIYFEKSPIKVDRIMKYHAFGTVSRGYDYMIYKNIETGLEEDEKVSRLEFFKQRYIEIKRLAETSNGRYFNIFYNGKELGWVHSYPIMRIHKMDPIGLKKSLFNKKMKQAELKKPVIFPNKTLIVEEFGVLNKFPKITLCNLPEIVNDAVELPITNEYKVEKFKIIEYLVFNEEVFCKLVLNDNSTVGYVRKEFLTFISEKEFNEENPSITEENDKMALPKIDLTMQKVPKFDDSLFNFVSMGRLSPEKNQKNLIIGFNKFNQINHESRLYILGDGPLLNELIELIRELKLEGKVFLLGHINNPFSFIKQNKYFVLPSIYEGQPMVLLEALTIGMKILASNIPANLNVIGEHEEYGLLINGTTAEDIYNGMNRAYTETIEFQKFDYNHYNDIAMASFYKQID